MNIFKSYKSNYKDSIQVDGAFSATHINYGESPVFHGTDSTKMAEKSRKNSLSSMDSIKDLTAVVYSFNGTEQNYKMEDRVSLWKNYWLEYIDAFDKLTEILPDSVVTVFIGRHTVEIGLKYLLLKKTGKVEKSHDLGELSALLFSEYNIKANYMACVDGYCELYCEYIEGGNVEYFRYPEYKKNAYFAGNRLSISWLSYNFCLIILKLIHFDGLDSEFT